jgi:hypothetical protein
MPRGGSAGGERAIADQGRTIRVPVHMGDQINKLIRVSHSLTQELGREPNPEELATAMQVPVKKAEQMIQVARRPISLETPTDEDEDSVLGDFIMDEDSIAPIDAVTSNMLREQFRYPQQPAAAQSASCSTHGLVDDDLTPGRGGRNWSPASACARQRSARACAIPPMHASRATTCFNITSQPSVSPPL